MMDNENGVFLFSSYNNSVYGNSFINNTHQVYDNVWLNPWLPQLLSVNFWDNITIGNYWSDYNGTDSDGDGIGDTPYIIDDKNQDNYPLMEPAIIPELASIYIRSDGSVEGTDKIQRNGNIYAFTDDINAEITVEIDDIVIDGADYSLQGNGNGVGIYVPNNGNLEIKNTKIQGFKFAIYFDYYSKNSNIISGNTLTNNTHYGIYIYSSNNRIFGNYIENSGTGIQLVESYNNTIFQNKIIENEEGIGFGSGGGYSTIFHNLIADNDYAFTFWANSQNTIYGNNLINNTNQVHVWSSSNNWDYQSMGNYWSDYNGTDSNGDGIGDTPYLISTSPENYGDADNYPLMEPLDDTVIPEFPSWTPLLVTLFAVLFVTVVYRKRLVKVS